MSEWCGVLRFFTLFIHNPKFKIRSLQPQPLQSWAVHLSDHAEFAEPGFWQDHERAPAILAPCFEMRVPFSGITDQGTDSGVAKFP